MQERSSLALKIGTTNHTILEGINRWIRDKKTEPDIHYFDTAAEELVESALPNDMILELRKTDKDLAKPEEQFIQEFKDTVINQLKCFARLYIEKANELFQEIVFIEKDHTFTIKDIPFRIIMDVVVRYKDGSLRVLDFKTKSMGVVDVSLLQLVSYGIGVEDMLKEPVMGLEQWDFIKVKNPYINIHKVDMNYYTGYKKVLEEETQTFWKGIHAGHFMRNLKSSYCGEKKCSFWNICMNTNEENPRKLESAEYHKEDVSNLSARRNR